LRVNVCIRAGDDLRFPGGGDGDGNGVFHGCNPLWLWFGRELAFLPALPVD
jgi:hypothetical protein